MLGVIEVKLVEHDSTLHLLISILGPLVILITAIFAAVVAAITAGRRQERQLVHDREIRRDDHRRDALDATLEIVEAAKLAYGQLLADIREADEARTMLLIDIDESQDPEEIASLRKQVSSWGDGIRPQWDKTFRRVEEFGQSIIRLKLRFFRHPIVDTAEVLFTKWGEVEKALRPALVRNLDANEEAACDRLHKEAGKAHARFMTTCATWLTGEEPAGIAGAPTGAPEAKTA